MKTNQRILAALLAALQVVTPTLSWAQSAPTTYITYDEVGQTKQITSPAGRTRQLQWDAVGRLSSETRGGSTVGYGYNGQDTLTSVTDARNLGTTYDRNGFGEARSQNSPDTAASTFSYDLNGNLTSRVNAAGQTESYAYDAANRVTSKTVSHPAQGTRTFTRTYGANGTAEAGNLTQISASGMTLGFTHNLFGQTTQASQALTGSVPLTTGYAYAANGTPTSITYPSGRVVTYTLDSSSRVTALTSAGTPLLSGITYSPLGALASWTFGGGQAVARTYDLNGRITGITMPSGTRAYTYDADDRLGGITDPVLGTATYDYDDLERLTSASTALGSWTYQYDATGNRVGSSGSASGTTVSIDNSSNRVLATSGAPSRLYTYTNDGHARLVDGAAAQPACGSSVTMGFQADGQMVSSNVLSAVHSPNGLRLQKTAAACAGGATTNFVYDLAGHLIGEYDGAGVVVQETVWLDNVPVAVFKPSVAPTPFYVYADNLGSPRAIINSSAQLVWQWDGEPFGATAANGNPTGLGDFGYNLRFPGQYLDVETGYHHNGWREYDPVVGRYVQSDPIGLVGGLNTYAYAEGNPLSNEDSRGLWASQKGAYVHQRAGYLVFGSEISQDELGVVAKGHEWADGPDHQSSAFTFMHAMRNANQTKAQACAQTDAFLHSVASRAIAAKQAGEKQKALFLFAVALHAMQDSTSPSHQGFQLWSGHETKREVVKHVTAELAYPGRGSELDRITSKAWTAFKAGDVNQFNVGCSCQ